MTSGIILRISIHTLYNLLMRWIPIAGRCTLFTLWPLASLVLSSSSLINFADLSVFLLPFSSRRQKTDEKNNRTIFYFGLFPKNWNDVSYNFYQRNEWRDSDEKPDKLLLFEISQNFNDWLNSWFGQRSRLKKEKSIVRRYFDAGCKNKWIKLKLNEIKKDKAVEITFWKGLE